MPTTAPRAGAKQDHAYRASVLAQVADRVGRRLDELSESGFPLASLGSPDQLVDQMVAALPPPQHPYDLALGPFYDTAGLTLWLAVSRQALADRVRRGSLLACRTADGHLVYPAFQFDGRGAIKAGLAPVLRVFARRDGWLAAAWLVTPTSALDGHSAIDWLSLGRDPQRVLTLAAIDVAGWTA